ncbi:MAG: hypothetical protein AB7O38_18945 [Pirellulaceae bacterium]
MDRSAHVTSIDAIRDLRAAFAQFGGEAGESIVMLTLEARKAMQWLLHDRARYWPEQLRKAQQRVIQARNELERCQLRYGSEEAPSCFVQKKALEKAKLRMGLCEEKVKAVKHWTNAVRKELEDFESEIARLSNWVETDLPRSLALLERMIRALDRYAGESRGLETRRPETSSSVANAADADPAAAAPDDASAAADAADRIDAAKDHPAD